MANILDSNAIKAVMESPIPIASLAIICFVAWRQMSLVRTTVDSTLKTFRMMFKAQSDKQDTFLAAFKDMHTKVDASEKKLMAALDKNNASVTDLTKQLEHIPVLMEKMVEQKLSMRPDTGAAVEARLQIIETKQVIHGQNTQIILEAIRKKFGGK